MLGRVVSRHGATCEPERVNAIVDFAPLREPSHVKQFAGSTNWIRWFLPAFYAAALKILGGWMNKKPEDFQKYVDTLNEKTIKDIWWNEQDAPQPAPFTGITRFRIMRPAPHLTEPGIGRGWYWVGSRLTRKQKTNRPDSTLRPTRRRLGTISLQRKTNF